MSYKDTGARSRVATPPVRRTNRWGPYAICYHAARGNFLAGTEERTRFTNDGDQRDADLPDPAPDAPDSSPPPAGDDAIETMPEQWLDRYGDWLFRCALVRLGDRAAASDAVQETLLAALTGVGEGRFDGRRVAFHHWLFAILRNKAVDQIRRRTRERPLDLSDPEGLGESVLYRLTGLPTTRPDRWAFDIEAAFERKEFWAAFEKCMAALNEVQRSVFTMKVLDGLATEEVCNILDITANHLGVVLYRARKALQRCLETTWIGED